MKDIELPPLPEPDICRYVVTVWRDGVECEIDKGPRYTVEQMQSYARTAVEADRAQRVPDTLCDDDLSDLAHSANQEALSFGLSHDVFLRYFKEVRRRLLASTPAPAQGAQRVPDGAISGALFDFAGFLTTLDAPVRFGSTEEDAPMVELLREFAKKRGLSLADADVMRWSAMLASTPAPAQQEPMGCGPRTPGVVYVCPEIDAACSKPECEHKCAAAQDQEPPQQERKPMTPEQVGIVCDSAGYLENGMAKTDFINGIRHAERHNGIKE